MEAIGTKGWEGRAAPGKWQLSVGEEEEGRGMEVGGLGLPWASRGCGVHQVTHPTAELQPCATAGSGWGGRLTLPYPLPAPACRPVPCKGVLGVGVPAPGMHPPARGEPCVKGAQANSHQLGKFLWFKTNCPPNRHVRLLEITISKPPFY